MISESLSSKRFLSLIRNYSLAFSEALTLDSNEDFFYVTDLNTDELILISASNPGLLNEGWKDYHGKKCYEVLQGKTSRCSFCTNHQLQANQDLIWQHYNPLTNRSYILKDRKINWKDRECRLEVVMDITEGDRATAIVLDSLNQQNLLMKILHSLQQYDTIEEGLEHIIHELIDFFKADACWIYAFKSSVLLKHCQLKNNQYLPVNEDITKENIQAWTMLLKDKQVVIQNTLELKNTDTESYALLMEHHLNSLCLTPVFSQNELIGIIGVGNISQNWKTLSLLKMLGLFLANSIQRRHLHDEYKKILTIDPLTSYPNYEFFKQEAARILKNNPDKKYSLWYCDIKRFKSINDIFGYQTGDNLLRYWASLIAENTRENETFCRFSADNMISLRYYDEPQELINRFELIAKKITEFKELKERSFQPEVITGIYLFDPQDTRLSLMEMLDRANIAQKSHKNLPGSHCTFYDETMRLTILKELELTSSASESMEKDAFLLYFQPQVALEKMHQKQPIKAEVLVRWQKENRLIMPNEFIGLFEQNGLIVNLDLYIFEKTCSYLSFIKKQLPELNLRLAVNISRITLFQPDFIEVLCAIRDRYDLKECSIELEFTENIAIKDVDAFAILVEKLQEVGFLCAMDDFGTGQSSLNVLRQLPLDILKLDRMFFNDPLNQVRGQIIISCILKMAKQLEITTVAEGIETLEQAEKLKALGCDYIQGYVYYRPMPQNDFTQFLIEYNSAKTAE